MWIAQDWLSACCLRKRVLDLTESLSDKNQVSGVLGGQGRNMPVWKKKMNYQRACLRWESTPRLFYTNANLQYGSEVIYLDLRRLETESLELKYIL
jgi:hypothetical protein